MTAAEIYLAAYDEQIRARITAAESAGGRADRDGPAVRKAWEGERGLITYRDLDGLDGAALDAFIARQRDHFTRLGHQAEWKYHSHDRPAGLPGRLAAAGFVPEDRETLLIGESARLAAAPDLPPGVTLREVTGLPDLDRIRDLEQAVWGDDHDWLPAALGRDLADPDDPCAVVVAEAGQQVVCAGWIRLHRGTDFASLWGGSTLPRWRRRGVYRATVAYRARLAAARGFRYIQVDASPDSRPVLARLGLLPVATTIPFIWDPAARAGPGKEPPDA
jgi:ribosomal protein S18 acetylase RimI-like enzyme